MKTLAIGTLLALAACPSFAQVFAFSAADGRGMPAVELSRAPCLGGTKFQDGRAFIHANLSGEIIHACWQRSSKTGYISVCEKENNDPNALRIRAPSFCLVMSPERFLDASTVPQRAQF